MKEPPMTLEFAARYAVLLGNVAYGPRNVRAAWQEHFGTAYPEEFAEYADYWTAFWQGSK